MFLFRNINMSIKVYSMSKVHLSLSHLSCLNASFTQLLPVPLPLNANEPLQAPPSLCFSQCSTQNKKKLPEKSLEPKVNLDVWQ